MSDTLTLLHVEPGKLFPGPELPGESGPLVLGHKLPKGSLSVFSTAHQRWRVKQKVLWILNLQELSLKVWFHHQPLKRPF